MEEDELIEKLKKINIENIDTPRHRAKLAGMLADAAATDRSRDLRWQLNPLHWFDFRRPAWHAAVSGALVVAIVAGMAVGLPMLTGNEKEISASEIALKDPRVKAALDGATPGSMAVTDGFGSVDISRVVMAVPPAEAVVVDVDMGSKKVTNVFTQSINDITEKQVLNLALSDTRVQELFYQGYKFYFDRVAELYTEPPPKVIDPYQKYGVDPEQMVGILGFLSLKLNYEKYLENPTSENYHDVFVYDVVVNISLGKIVLLEGPHSIVTLSTSTSKIISNYESMLFGSNYAPPDPGSVNGEQPEEYSHQYVEHTPYHLKVEEIDRVTGRRYATFTWDIQEEDIEGIIESVANTPSISNLLSEGARIVSFEANYVSAGHGSFYPTTWTHGLQWIAYVHIEKGDIRYNVQVNVTTGWMMLINSNGYLKPKTSSPYEIVLP